MSLVDANNFNNFVSLIRKKSSMQILIKKIKLISAFILLLVPVLSQAQDSPSHDFILSVQGQTGYAIAHHSNMTQLIKGHLLGGELNYVFRTDGSRPWHQIHKYPEIGMTAIHLDLGNPQQLGTLEGIYPYANIRLNNLNRKISFNLKLGLGLCYITRPFDRITNHQDNAIGSHVNAFVNLRLNTIIPLSKSWRLEVGVGLSHASNGAMKTPNLGLNMTTLNLGVGYAFGNKDLQLKKDTIIKPKRVLITQVIGLFGIKELMPPGTQRYTSYGLMANFYYKLNDKNKIGGGAEMSYCNSLRKYLSDDSLNVTTANLLRAGIKISYAFNMNRISLPIDFGFYVFDKQNFDGRFFHRVGLRYLINKHLIANATLITHWAVADYFEWGLGYQF